MISIQTWRLDKFHVANEANSSEHWAKKSKRHRTQKLRIKSAFKKDRLTLKLPCTVTLTRIAPRKLDTHDNLRISLKWIVDSIAEELTGNYVPGRADDNKDIKWEYKQEKGNVKEYALRIQIKKYE